MALPSFLQRFRNSLLANPKFLARAQRNALMRPIVQDKSLQLFDILAGFTYSQVLAACVSLGVFEKIGLAGCGRAEFAAKIGLEPGPADVLLRAAVALDLLAYDAERVSLGPHGAALLAQPWIMQFIEHHAALYQDLADPVARLQGKHEGTLRQYWNYADSPSGKEAYSALMAASQEAVSQQILDAYDLRRHRRILDVGGGTGMFLAAAGTRHPHLELHLFDLPGVVRLVGHEVKGRRMTCHGGDFRCDPLPSGMDIISVVRVVHDHDDADVLALLRNIRLVCSPQTVLLIAEPFSGNPATARVTDAYFGLYFSAMGQGRTRTPQEIAGLAAQAGFERPREWRTNMPLLAGVMTLYPNAAHVEKKVDIQECQVNLTLQKSR